MNNPLATFKKETTAVGAFNADAYHAMQARDDQLIRDGVLHGYTGKEYVYNFKINGAEVTGVSVVGARELAAHYGGIKSRIVASVDKTGSLFVFKSFEPLAIQAQIIPQLADDPDFYEVVMEITDIKTGNSLQVRKKETKTEKRRDGSSYDRPHYDVIAESKAYRNGVLSIIPQNVIYAFEQRALQAGNKSQEKTIDQLRAGILGFAAKNALALDRQAINDLLYAEISGLGTAANQGIGAFKESVAALGLLHQEIQDSTGEAPSAEKTEKPNATREVNQQEVKMSDVQRALETATTRAELDEAADLIREVKNPTHQKLLNGIYETRGAELH